MPTTFKSTARIILLTALAALVHSLFIAFLSAPTAEAFVYYPDAILFGTFFGLLAISISKIVFDEVRFRNGRYEYLMGFFISFLITMLCLMLITWLFYGILKGLWVIGLSMFKEQLVILNFQVLVTLFYLGHKYSVLSAESKNRKLEEENRALTNALGQYKKRVSATMNGKTLILDIDQVRLFKIKEGVIFAHTKNDKKYTLQYTTLHQLEEVLNPQIFFRINRSEIVNIEFLESYESYLKDRLAIKIQGMADYLYTSNTKSPDFKKWIA